MWVPEAAEEVLMAEEVTGEGAPADRSTGTD